jgi:hypothetical protein
LPAIDGSIAGKLRIDLPLVGWVRPGIQTKVSNADALCQRKRRGRKKKNKQ